MGLRLPWVSRALFDHVKEQLATCESERKRMLDALMYRADERTPEPEREEHAAEPSAAFTTPFDRALTRFDQAKKDGKVTPRYRARA